MFQVARISDNSDVTDASEPKGNRKTSYQCWLCAKTVRNLKGLHKHVTTRHPDHQDAQVKCLKCEETFSTEQFLDHNKVYKDHEKGAKCTVCQDNIESFKEHMTVHFKDDIWTCHLCVKRYGNRERLTSHINVHIDYRPYLCKTCGLGFPTAGWRRKHTLSEHATSPPKRFLCTLCDKTFRSKCALRRHEGSHSSERPYICDICGQGFKRNCHLLIHKRMHADERPHRCDTCGKRFRSRPCLRDHNLTHTGVRPHVCETCGKAFRYKGNLRTHYLLHTGEKPYRCDSCDLRFRHQSSYDNHMKIHKASAMVLSK